MQLLGSWPERTCVPLPDPGPPRTKTMILLVFFCWEGFSGAAFPGCTQQQPMIPERDAVMRLWSVGRKRRLTGGSRTVDDGAQLATEGCRTVLAMPTAKRPRLTPRQGTWNARLGESLACSLGYATGSFMPRCTGQSCGTASVIWTSSPRQQASAISRLAFSVWLTRNVSTP